MGLDFPDLLEQVENIRVDSESHAFDYIRTHMLDLTKGTMSIGIEDLPHLVKSVHPPLEVDEEALAIATREVFASSNKDDGHFSFPEVKRALQRSREIENRRARALEINSVIENGFKGSELDELHAAFSRLDDDNSGRLDVDEAFQAVLHLESQMPREVFEAAYVFVDEDASGGLDFQEFLTLLRLMR